MNITHYNFYSAYHHLNDFFGIVLNEDDFENYGLNAWGKIGNKRTHWYTYTGNTVNSRLALPCNVDIIESVHANTEDFANKDNVIRDNYTNSVIEQYIESRKMTSAQGYHRGKLLDFHQEEADLVFDRNYNGITVVYKGIIADDQGLPFINRKEMEAIAIYCAYVATYKKALQTHDQATMALAKDLEMKWAKSHLQARTPELMTQNEMNEILDVSTRWDRKRYGMSYKPFLK